MNVCRVSDIGIGVCPAHKSPRSYITVFGSGAKTVLAEAKQMVRVGDVGVSSCGHPTIALVGSKTVLCEGAAVHRCNDTGANAGPYVATTAAVTVSNSL